MKIIITPAQRELLDKADQIIPCPTGKKNWIWRQSRASEVPTVSGKDLLGIGAGDRDEQLRDIESHYGVDVRNEFEDLG